MPNLQIICYFKLEFQKLDQHTRAKLLIHGIKHPKDNQLRACDSPIEYASWENIFDIKGSDGSDNIFNPVF